MVKIQRSTAILIVVVAAVTIGLVFFIGIKPPQASPTLTIPPVQTADRVVDLSASGTPFSTLETQSSGSLTFNGDYIPHYWVKDSNMVLETKLKTNVILGNGTARIFFVHYASGSYDILFNSKPAGGLWYLYQGIDTASNFNSLMYQIKLNML